MKIKILCLFLPLLLFGCSKKAAEAPETLNHSLTNVRMVMGIKPGKPIQMQIVESAETKEMNDISNRAIVLLETKDYAGLDAFAGKLRDSKACFDGGAWKFYFVYAGLELPEETSNTAWAARLDALQEYINARTNSITARVALANDLVTYAWKARGSGWADSVTDEGWRLFSERLNKAVKVLDDARPLNEQCPYYWSVLLTTDLGLQVERSKYDATFEEATRTWPDYSAYYNRRAWYLMPRWYGTEGEWESDLEKSADQKGGEGGDLLYARVIWCMHHSYAFTNIFKECNLSWPRVDKGFGVMEKQFPNSLAAKSEHAYLAVLARDATVARREFDAIDGKVDLSVWRSTGQFLSFAYWAYNLGGVQKSRQVSSNP